jgi:hypothetical protein
MLKKSGPALVGAGKKFENAVCTTFIFFSTEQIVWGRFFPVGVGIIVASWKKQAKETCNTCPILLNRRSLTKVDIHMKA